MKIKDISVKVQVDTSELDAATEKANRLVELLGEASSIISSLSSEKLEA